jgi:hypothetical protein
VQRQLAADEVTERGDEVVERPGEPPREVLAGRRGG